MKAKIWKKYLIIILLLSLYPGSFIISQCDIESILTKLNSEYNDEIYEALDSIIICNITEAIPELEDKFNDEKGITLKYYLLNTLYKLDAENINKLLNHI